MQILIPVQLQKAMRELPPIPELRVNAPFLSILFEGSIIRIINTLIPIFKAILIPVGLFLILGLMFIQQKTYQSQLLNHSVLTESYFELLESYSLRQSEQSSDRHHSKFR